MTTILCPSPSISTSGVLSIYFRNYTIWSRSISAFFLTTSHQQHDRKWPQHHFRVSTFPPLAQQFATNAISYKTNNGIVLILLEGGLMRKRCSDLGYWPVFRVYSRSTHRPHPSAGVCGLTNRSCIPSTPFSCNNMYCISPVTAWYQSAPHCCVEQDR